MGVARHAHIVSSAELPSGGTPVARVVDKGFTSIDLDKYARPMLHYSPIIDKQRRR